MPEASSRRRLFGNDVAKAFALHSNVSCRIRPFSMPAFMKRAMGVVYVVFPAAAKTPGVSPALLIRGFFFPRLGLLGLLAFFVRSPRPADPFRIWMFSGHAQRSC